MSLSFFRRRGRVLEDVNRVDGFGWGLHSTVLVGLGAARGCTWSRAKARASRICDSSDTVTKQAWGPNTSKTTSQIKSQSRQAQAKSGMRRTWVTRLVRGRDASPKSSQRKREREPVSLLLQKLHYRTPTNGAILLGKWLDG